MQAENSHQNTRNAHCTRPCCNTKIVLPRALPAAGKSEGKYLVVACMQSIYHLHVDWKKNGSIVSRLSTMEQTHDEKHPQGRNCNSDRLTLQTVRKKKQLTLDYYLRSKFVTNRNFTIITNDDVVHHRLSPFLLSVTLK